MLLGRINLVWAMIGTALLVACGAVLLISARVAEAAFPGQNGAIAFVASDDALVHCGCGSGDDVFTMRPDGTGTRNFTQDLARDMDPTWSPDGTKIAFVSNLIPDLVSDIQVKAVSDGTRTNLDVHGNHPAWSPDGSKIAFDDTDGANNFDIWVMNADGSGRTNLTKNGYQPAWSPNGRQIAFTRNGDIWIMNPDGTGQENLTSSLASGVEDHSTWSPDGSKIAFTRSEGGGPFDIWVMSADGSGHKNLTNTTARETQPAWSPDGGKIAYARKTINPEQSGTAEFDWNIWKMNAANGKKRVNLTNTLLLDETQPDWRPKPAP